MVRKISFLLISVAVLVTGAIAFRKLSYWERSIRIFSYSSGNYFEGRGGRGGERGRGLFFNEGREEFEGRQRSGDRGEFERPERQRRDLPGSETGQMPDSIRSRFGGRRGFQEIGERNIPDSLRRQFRPGDGGERDRGSLPAGFRGGNFHGRGEFPGGKKVNLRNVKWFLAVFAGLTVVAIYADKGFRLVFKKKRPKPC